MERWLVLSGGGRYGAWQAGAYRALASAGTTYTGVVGVSTGALSAALISRHDNDLTAADALCDLYARTETRDVWRWHPWYKYLRPAKLESIIDARPLKRIVNNVLAKPCKRPWAVCTTDVHSQETMTWVRPSAATVMASAAYPGVFPPVMINLRLHIDGGIRAAVPLQAVPSTATHVDVLSITSEARQSWIGGTVWDYLQRALAIQRDEIVRNDLHQHAGDPTRRVFRPAVPLNGNLFSFNSARSRELIDQGQADVYTYLRNQLDTTVTPRAD